MEKEEKNNKIIKELIPYVVIIITVVFIRTFIVTPVRVDGSSMERTLSDGEILILNKYDYQFNRFDIVVFDYEGTKLIKRIIGLPGETIQYKDDKLYINKKRIKEPFERNSLTDDFKLSEMGVKKIPNDTYFVLGDNRGNSTDSRMIGVISKNQIKGTVKYRIYPLNKINNIEKR